MRMGSTPEGRPPRPTRTWTTELWTLAVLAAAIGVTTSAPRQAAAQMVEIRPYAPGQEPGTPGYREQRSREPHTFEGAIYLGVPIATGNDIDRDIIRPGVDLGFRGGWNLGFIQPELEAGWRWTFIDLDEAAEANPGFRGTGRDTLRSFYFAAGARLRIPNRSIVVPFASTMFGFNWWNFRETGVACGWYYCSTRNVFRFTPAFQWRFGLSIAPNPAVAIEAGLGVNLSFPGDFFDQNRSWLSPFLGVSFRD